MSPQTIHFLANILSQVQSSDFAKFVLGALVAGSLYLLVTKISEKLTSGLVRKDELAKTLHNFKEELVKELVTSQDMRIFKLEQEASIEKAMKETRHSIANELQHLKTSADEAAAVISARMGTMETVLARIDEHVKLMNPPPINKP